MTQLQWAQPADGDRVTVTIRGTVVRSFQDSEGRPILQLDYGCRRPDISGDLYLDVSARGVTDIVNLDGERVT